MNKELDKDRARDLLNNWRRWSKDDQPDPAIVYYYTVSPMFRDFVKPASSGFVYDSDAAMMVEEVLRLMCRGYRRERDLICDYYLRGCSSVDLADSMGVSKSTMYRRLDMAIKVFGEKWALLVSGH